MNDLRNEMEFLRAGLAKPYLKNPAPHWSVPKDVYKCKFPHRIMHEGETIPAPCRKCSNCRKSRMQEWSARGIAEGLVSDDIAFITHTYDPKKYPREAQEFHKENTQRFCQNLRNYLRPWGGRVRYLITGERGSNGQQQVHWHGMYFFQGKSGLENSPTEGPNKGRSWPENRRGKKLWPYGHLNIEKIDPRNAQHVARRVRYVVKYMFKDTVNHKGFRGGDVAKMRASKGRRIGPDGLPESEPLGTRFFEEEARRAARNMVHLTQDVAFPGIVNKRGRLQKHSVFGIIRDYVIRAYKTEVCTLLPEGSNKRDDLLTGPFLEKYDPEAPRRFLKSIREEIERKGTYRPRKPIWYRRKEYRQNAAVLPTQRPELRISGSFPVVRRNGRQVGRVDLNSRGMAKLFFLLPYRGWKIGEVYKIVNGSLRDVFPESDFDHDALEAWLKERRGPEWLSPEEYRKKRAEKLEQLNSALLRFSDRRGAEGNTTAIRRKLLSTEQHRAMSRGEAWWMWDGRFRPGHFGDDGSDENRNRRVWREMFDPEGRFVMQDDLSARHQDDLPWFYEPPPEWWHKFGVWGEYTLLKNRERVFPYSILSGGKMTGGKDYWDEQRARDVSRRRAASEAKNPRPEGRGADWSVWLSFSRNSDAVAETQVSADAKRHAEEFADRMGFGDAFRAALKDP